MASNREGYTEIKIGTIPAKLKIDVCVYPTLPNSLLQLASFSADWFHTVPLYVLRGLHVDSKMPLVLAPLYCHFSAAIWSLAGHF